MKTLKIISERVFKAGYVLRRELIESPCEGDDPYEWTMAYTPRGDYIGDSKTARRLVVQRGIQPEKTSDDHCVCSIGFSVKDGKWYGWSHRALYGFKVGSKCKNGDVHYRPETPEKLKKSITAPDEDGWAWQKPEDVELIEGGVRVRPRPIMVHAIVEPDDLADAIESLPDAPGEPTCAIEAPGSFEIRCGRGEWTAKTVADARQMALDFAEGVS